MITNERQYRITRSWLERFQQARAGVEQERCAHLHPRARQAFRDQYDSQIEELQQQLAEYDALPEALIRARIAAGLTQKELARRLGLKEQQIQRYEATRYASASLARIRAVSDALGLKIHERVILPTARG